MSQCKIINLIFKIEPKINFTNKLTILDNKKIKNNLKIIFRDKFII